MEKEEKKFATEYQINGKKYAGEIWATSWEEAESFISPILLLLCKSIFGLH